MGLRDFGTMAINMNEYELKPDLHQTGTSPGL